MCYTCKPHFHCSALFGTILVLTFYNAQRSLCYSTRIAHAPTLRWSWFTGVWCIFNDQRPSEQLCRRLSTTPNDSHDAKHAFQHARALRFPCVTRVGRVSTAQHPSEQLFCRLSTTLHDPHDAKQAYQHARALRCPCVTRVSRISTAQHSLVQFWS